MTGSPDEQFSRIAEAGYDGVESAVEEIADRGKFMAILEEYHLEYIPLIYTEGDHLENFRRLIKLAASFNPKKIVAHSGRDLWNFEEQIKFFRATLEIE